LRHRCQEVHLFAEGDQEPVAVKARYVRLIRTGMKGAAAARRSLWYLEAGSMAPDDKPVSSRFLTQDDRIAIAESLAAGVPAALIAAQLGKHRSTLYREIARGRTETRYRADRSRVRTSDGSTRAVRPGPVPGQHAS
jgi:DNA invertase Pin-like site-specific DNA recombinase